MKRRGVPVWSATQEQKQHQKRERTEFFPDGRCVKDVMTMTSSSKQKVSLALVDFEARFLREQNDALLKLEKPPQLNLCGLDVGKDKEWSICLRDWQKKWEQTAEVIVPKNGPLFSWETTHKTLVNRKSWFAEVLGKIFDEPDLVGLVQAFQFVSKVYDLAYALDNPQTHWQSPMDTYDAVVGEMPHSSIANKREMAKDCFEFVQQFCQHNFASLTTALVSAQFIARSRDPKLWQTLQSHLTLRSIAPDFMDNRCRHLFALKTTEKVFLLSISYDGCMYDVLLPRDEAMHTVYRNQLAEFARLTIIPGICQRLLTEGPKVNFLDQMVPEQLMMEKEFLTLKQEEHLRLKEEHKLACQRLSLNGL